MIIGKIYCLKNPLKDNEIFYVGRTKLDLDDRLQKHIQESKVKKTVKNSIINDILSNNFKVVIETLETIEGNVYGDVKDKLIEREMFWIKKIGLLSNIDGIVYYSKICEKCFKEFESEKKVSKFCSTSCRVMWHRKNKVTSKGFNEKQRLEVLYNSILELLDSAKSKTFHQKEAAFSPIIPSNNIGVSEIAAAPKIIRSFEYYQKARAECLTGEDWEELKSEILASSLSIKQKSLLTN